MRLRPKPSPPGECRFAFRAEALRSIRLPPTPCEGRWLLCPEEHRPSRRKGCCPKAAGRRHRTRQYDVALSSRASASGPKASGCPFAFRSGSAFRGLPRSAIANVRDGLTERKPKSRLVFASQCRFSRPERTSTGALSSAYKNAKSLLHFHLPVRTPCRMVRGPQRGDPKRSGEVERLLRSDWS